MKKVISVFAIAGTCLAGGAVAGLHNHLDATPSGNALTSDAVRTGSTASAATTLTSNMSLTSDNGDYQLLMSADGDLVENSLHGISPIYHTYGDLDGNDYIDGGNVSAEENWSVTGTYVGEHVTQIWHSGTANNPGARAVLQNDGNFVIYSASNAVLWASDTAGNPGTTLSVQNDGNIVLYDSGQALWATKAVSIVDGHGSNTVNFRSCPGVDGDNCEIIKALPSGTGITMLCWEDVLPQGWATPPPSNRWFYSLIDGTQDGLGYIDAAFVDGQIKTPECIPPTPGEGNPPQPAPLPESGSPGSGTSPAGPQSQDAPATTFTEIVGGPTHTWTDYNDAGGYEGATIPAGESVQVTCVVQGFTVADGNTNWYLIASSPWSNSYYASSDAFYNNGATSGSLDGTPYVDPSVPAC